MHNKIPPHITLVFPFALSANGAGFAVETTRQIVRRFARFSVGFGAPTTSPDGYASLPLIMGADAVRNLHDALYATAPFAPFLNTNLAYVPHLTIRRTTPGDTKRTADITAAFAELRETITEASVIRVIVESFGADDVSFVEAAIPLM